MTKLETYHSFSYNPYFSWENSKLSELIKSNQLKNYNQYQIACSLNNIIPVKQVIFNNHIKQKINDTRNYR